MPQKRKHIGKSEAAFVISVAYYQIEPTPKPALETLRRLASKSKRLALEQQIEKKIERFEEQQRSLLLQALEAVVVRKGGGVEDEQEFIRLINMLLPDLLATFNPYQRAVRFRSRYLTSIEAQHSRFTRTRLQTKDLNNPAKVGAALADAPGTYSDIADASYALVQLYINGLAQRFRRCLMCDHIYYADDLKSQVCPKPRNCAEKRALERRKTPEYRKKRRDYMEWYRNKSGDEG